MDLKNALINVSIIVPCYNEERNIGYCLESLVKQDYTGSYEIIVIDGNSKDNTQAIIKEFTRLHANIRLIIESKKGVAAGRNAGIRAARHDYIAFIDADCEAPKNWLSQLIESYRKIKAKYKDVIGVGGRNIVPGRAGNFPKAVGIVLDSYIGSFNSIQGRQFKSPIFVPSISTVNALYEKEKIVKAGYFDESLQSEAEDADINYRLRSSGSRFLFIPDSFVWHKMRPTPKTWLKNMFRYGKGRARLLKRYPKMWDLPFTLPLIFMLAMFSIVLIPFSRIFALPMLYFPVIFCFSFLKTFSKKCPALFLHVVFIYIIQHFGYAAGEIYGLASSKVR